MPMSKEWHRARRANIKAQKEAEKPKDRVITELFQVVPCTMGEIIAHFALLLEIWNRRTKKIVHLSYGADVHPELCKDIEPLTCPTNCATQDGVPHKHMLCIYNATEHTINIKLRSPEGYGHRGIPILTFPQMLFAYVYVYNGRPCKNHQAHTIAMKTGLKLGSYSSKEVTAAIRGYCVSQSKDWRVKELERLGCNYCKSGACFSLNHAQVKFCYGICSQYVRVKLGPKSFIIYGRHNTNKTLYGFISNSGLIIPENDQDMIRQRIKDEFKRRMSMKKKPTQLQLVE